jgi:hypothetical protein
MGFPMVHVGPHWSIGFRRFLAETHNEVVSACTEFAVLLAMQRELSQALLLAMQRGLSSGATASAQSASSSRGASAHPSEERCHPLARR